VTHDLSARIPRERGNAYYRGRTCVGGKLVAAQQPQLLFDAGLGPGLRHDEGDRAVISTDHTRFGDGRMLQQDSLDQSRVDESAR